MHMKRTNPSEALSERRTNTHTGC